MSPLQLSASQGEPLLVSPASSFSAPPPRAWFSFLPMCSCI
jgi:hypothetical protein